MKKYIYSGILVLLFISCSSSKFKMGKYVYDIKYERWTNWEPVHGPIGYLENPGDASTLKWIEEGDSLPVIITSKELYLNGERILGCDIKAQRHGLEREKDSVFLKGNMFINGDLLICIQQGQHSYRNNSIRVQVMEQQVDGSFKFKKYFNIAEDEYMQ